MNISLRKVLLVICLPAMIAGVFLTAGFAPPALACNYYASPNGVSNGLSTSSPFKIADFWKVAGPGKMLCLLDGIYTDSASTIRPPQHLNGTASARITIKALNDGKVRINGGGVRNPVMLYYNDYFLLEGFDAHNSTSTVINISNGSDNNIIRRVCAWDAADANTTIFGVHGNTRNLLEDTCGFGIARKIYSNSQGGNNLIIRRAWGRWERTNRTEAKSTFNLAYNSYNATYENVIGTWDENGSSPSTERYGILSQDALAGPDFCANSRYFGSIAYVANGAVMRGFLGNIRASSSVDCLVYKDNVAFLGSKFSATRPTNLTNISAARTGYAPGFARFLSNHTEIGGSGAVVGSDWTVTNRSTGATVAAVPNIWNGSGSSGARACKKYQNGVLTNKPLWPWPMNQRIINAMKAAGKTPVDVTKTMEQIFGAIPAECRSGSSKSFESTPAPPENLVIQ